MSREVAHRTKNALAILGALIEAKRRRSQDAREAGLLGDIARRVRAIGSLQGLLESVKGESEGIGLDHFLRELACELDAPTDIQVLFEGAPDVRLTADSALAAALCITEMVLNAQKHGFPEDRPGTIRIAGFERDGRVVLSVSDDGVGLPEDFAPERSDGLGMLVVLDQVRRLRGEVTCGASAVGGAQFEVAFPS